MVRLEETSLALIQRIESCVASASIAKRNFVERTIGKRIVPGAHPLRAHQSSSIGFQWTEVKWISFGPQLIEATNVRDQPAREDETDRI